jgi:hypothetical protein
MVQAHMWLHSCSIPKSKILGSYSYTGYLSHSIYLKWYPSCFLSGIRQNVKWNVIKILWWIQRHELDFFYSASSLKQQSVVKHVAPLATLSRFRANRSLLLLLNSAYQFYSLWFDSRPRCDHPYTTDAVKRLSGHEKHTCMFAKILDRFGESVKNVEYKVHFKCPTMLVNVKDSWLPFSTLSSPYTNSRYNSTWRFKYCLSCYSIYLIWSDHVFVK